MSEDKHEHGDVHFAWAWGGVGERVHYRLGAETRFYMTTVEVQDRNGQTRSVQVRRAKFGPTREITVKQAESYMLVPDKDYSPDGRDTTKWVGYLKRLCDSVMRLEKDKPGTIVRSVENP